MLNPMLSLTEKSFNTNQNLTEVESLRLQTTCEEIDLKEVVKNKEAAQIQTTMSGDDSIRSRKKSMYRQNTETRITITLALIMTSFIVCWLPFFIVYNVRSFLDDPKTIPDIYLDILTWLGYMKSSFDPVIYLILNEHFRFSFIQLAKCNK